MLTAIDSQIGPYRLKRQIGAGGFGRVYLVEHTTNQTQALTLDDQLAEAYLT